MPKSYYYICIINVVKNDFIQIQHLLARNGQVEVCKSRRHSDGEKCFGSDDWFIVMAILPTGQVSNHYKSKYWDLFDVPERETAFEYDGHTPNEAADRLKKYLKLPRRGY